jgi:hypothetical protein
MVGDIYAAAFCFVAAFTSFSFHIGLKKSHGQNQNKTKKRKIR